MTLKGQRQESRVCLKHLWGPIQALGKVHTGGEEEEETDRSGVLGPLSCSALGGPSYWDRHYLHPARTEDLG